MSAPKAKMSAQDLNDMFSGPPGVPGQLNPKQYQQQLKAKARVLQANLDALEAQNVRDINALAARGGNFSPLEMFNARIDCLIVSIAEALGPEGEIWALQARLLAETNLAENVQRGLTEVSRKQLAVGGALSPEQMRLLAKATGTFGG